METNTSPDAAGANENGGVPAILPVPEPTFEDRLRAVEKMKENLVAEGRTRLEQIGSERRRLDAEEARLRDFLGMDKAAPEPVVEKKPKAARGSVRQPVLDFYRERGLIATATKEAAEATGLDLDQVQGAAAKLAKDGLLVRAPGKSTYYAKAAAA